MKKRTNTKNRMFLTTGAAARHCQVSPAALKRWIRAGRLSGFQTVGGHARIPLEEFQRFLHEHRMPPYSEPALEPIAVLVVDDEPEVVDFLAALLAEHPRGFKVETATDGYEALIKVGAFKPALLILDVRMPRLAAGRRRTPEEREDAIPGRSARDQRGLDGRRRASSRSTPASVRGFARHASAPEARSVSAASGYPVIPRIFRSRVAGLSLRRRQTSTPSRRGMRTSRISSAGLKAPTLISAS